MRKVVVDMRRGAIAEDVFERCRLSGTPLTIVASRECKPEERMLGVRWDVLRGCAYVANSETIEDGRAFHIAEGTVHDMVERLDALRSRLERCAVE